MSLNEFIQIGSRIKAIRKEKGLSQKYMADEVLNIPYSTYSNYENNNRVPNKDTIKKIATTFDVEVSYLLGLEKDSVGIGGKIEKYRKAKTISREELGGLIGKSQHSIKKYELGEVTPSIDIIEKIAKALDICISDLLEKEAIADEPIIYQDEDFIIISKTRVVKEECIERIKYDLQMDTKEVE